MEEYGLDVLAASADAVVLGLGPLAVMLARLAVEAGQTGTLEEMELLAGEQGREILRGVLQLSLDRQAAAEVRLPWVAGADGVARTRAERGHSRAVVTTLGEVRVRRIGYRSGVRGVPSLFPRDAVLNLPPLGYSWQRQRLAEMFSRSGSYGQAHELVLAATGVSIGKRQLEQITAAAAAGAELFYQDPDRGQGVVPGTGENQQEGLPPLPISADGKGVAMRPEARRRRTKAPGQRVRNFDKRRGTGEQGHKRMAETGCVFGRRRPRRSRRPGAHPRADHAPRTRQGQERAARGEPLVHHRHHRRPRRHHRQGLRRSRTPRPRPPPDLDRAGGRRHLPARPDPQPGPHPRHPPGHPGRFHPRAGIPVESRLVLPPPRDPAMEDWVIAQALDILHGRAAGVTARIRQLAQDHPPKPGGEHEKIIRKTLHYLHAKQPYLDYPAALAAGWPIATGVIEGACRHLVNDRMGITGARWGLPGAQAILWLRALHASGDLSAYWDYHIAQEHQRNHLNRYKDSLGPAA